jgi:hypothetical protein
MARVIPLEALTVEDVVNLGERAVTDQLPISLLVTMARLLVAERQRDRMRHAALSTERRVYREASGVDEDGLLALVNAAAMKAAAEISFDWRPLLNSPFLVPSRERVVTWGAASIADHSDRAGWLERQASGNLRTAVEHRAAIDDIDRHGVRNLFQVVVAS